MRNVVAYCRVSTDAQAGDDKFGIESQKDIVMKYCSEHDMQVSDWYIDRGESGTKENRPALDQLLFGEVKNPPVTAVIVAKSDRVARDIKLYFYYMMLLQKKGIELISATEELVNDETGLGGVYKALMMFVAEQERKNITKRTSGGRIIKATNGGYSGGRTPFGYKAQDGKMVIVPEQAEIVREIFSMKDAGATLKDIADTMNKNGYTTSGGGIFYTSAIQRIVDNRKTYEGYYHYKSIGRDEWVKGKHEPILK